MRHAFHYQYTLLIGKLFQNLRRLLGIHIRHDQRDHLRTLVLQDRQKRLGIALHEEIERLRLERLGHFLQKVAGRRLAERLLEDISSIIQAAVRHHLMCQAKLIELIQRGLHLIVRGLSKLCHFVCKVFNILFIQIFINLGSPVGSQGYHYQRRFAPYVSEDIFTAWTAFGCWHSCFCCCHLRPPLL